jgi:glycosyltransferase involved in cell wall biosynthesis
MSASPVVTVVLPNFNHSRYIGQAIEAIVGQDPSPAAIIIIDDASSDDSVQVIENYRSGDQRIQIVAHTDNRGVNIRCNEGLGQVETEFVIFAAADDRLLPGLFRKSLTLLARHDRAAYCSSGSLLTNGEGRTTGTFSLPPVTHECGWMSPARFRANQARHGNWVMGNTVVYRTRMLREAGGFPPELASYADGFCTLLLGRVNGVCYIDEPLACWRRSDKQYSTQTSTDAEKMYTIMQLVIDRMENRYASLFTADEIDRWRRRWSYEAIMSNHDGSVDDQGLLQRFLAKTPAQSSRFSRRLLRAVAGRDRLFRHALFLVLRPFDIVPGIRRVLSR